MPMIPKVTALFIALHALLLLFLAFRVVAARRGLRIGIGDGAQEIMQRRIRVHGNATEYLPIALLELLALELLGLGALWLYVAGGTLFVARCLHAMGLSGSSGTSSGRFLGTLLTWLVMIVMAVTLLVLALR